MAIAAPSPSAAPSVAAFRREYRAKIGPLYSGWGHLGLTSAGALSVIVFSLFQVESLSWIECLMVPLTFGIANVVEFLMHRGPMHRPLGWASELYKRHTLEHHYFYTHEAMAAESASARGDRVVAPAGETALSGESTRHLRARHAGGVLGAHRAEFHAEVPIVHPRLALNRPAGS